MDERDIKLDRLLDMQDNPQNYSDEELEAMLNDPEMQEDIRCLTAMRKAGLFASEECGVRSEELYASPINSNSNTNSKSNNSSLLTPHSSLKIYCSLKLYKFAAMFIGVVLLAGVTFAAVRFIKQREPMPIAENTEEVVNKPSSESTELKTDTVATPKATLIVFDGEEMETVARNMAEYYGVDVRFDSEEAKHVKLFFRWDRKMPIATVVDILNKYDRINIELSDGTLIIK